jgi:branched-chain amino acid transport system substrate-binding protein
MVRSASSRVSNHDPHTIGGPEMDGQPPGYKISCPGQKPREPKMKSGLLAAVAAGGLLLALPASAQGVKIGILNDQSGVYADYGGKYSVEAARMAIEDFGGSVLGQKIELTTADHQNKPDLATSIARRWYDVEGVDMITELTTSSVALAVQELSKEKKKIDIVIGAATSRITGDACTPYGFHWAFDTHALAVGTGGALVKAGGDTWFFMTADYAFGYSLEKDTSEIVTANGGKVLGSVRIPLNSSDFSSFLLQAQSSKAKIIGLANAGLDTTNSIKQAAEFGIVKGGQKLAGLLLTLAEVHGLGLEAAQGLVLTEGFYWDRNDKSREFSERFMKRTGRMPNMIQAGTYSATLQYLKAVKAAGTKDSDAVVKKLKELPVDDMFAEGGKVLANGRMVHNLYLFEVKKPSESKKPWDYYKQLAVVPGDTAFPSAKDSGCPLTK